MATLLAPEFKSSKMASNFSSLMTRGLPLAFPGAFQPQAPPLIIMGKNTNDSSLQLSKPASLVKGSTLF
jgi:hypothetical protein